MENHHSQWVNQLFRLGHFQYRTVKLPEGTTPLQRKFQLTKVSLPTSHALEAAVHRLHGGGIPGG